MSSALKRWSLTRHWPELSSVVFIDSAYIVSAVNEDQCPAMSEFYFCVFCDTVVLSVDELPVHLGQHLKREDTDENDCARVDRCRQCLHRESGRLRAATVAVVGPQPEGVAGQHHSDASDRVPDLWRHHPLLWPDQQPRQQRRLPLWPPISWYGTLQMRSLPMPESRGVQSRIRSGLHLIYRYVLGY